MSSKKARAADRGNCCIALLRAVNVGGRSVAMAELRAMLAELGCGNPRTLLQSGNAVFTLKARTSLATFEAKLEEQAAPVRRRSRSWQPLPNGRDHWRNGFQAHKRSGASAAMA
jgi:hypothetical protein